MNRRSFIYTTGISSVSIIAGCVSESRNNPSNDDASDGSEISRSTAQTTEGIKLRAKDISYDELFRGISDYKGTEVHYRGSISDFFEQSEGYQEMIIILEGPSRQEAIENNERYEQHAVAGIWRGDLFREGDDVEFWGSVLGLRTYMSMTGEKSIPEIEIIEMELL